MKSGSLSVSSSEGKSNFGNEFTREDSNVRRLTRPTEFIVEEENPKGLEKK